MAYEGKINETKYIIESDGIDPVSTSLRCHNLVIPVGLLLLFFCIMMSRTQSPR